VICPAETFHQLIVFCGAKPEISRRGLMPPPSRLRDESRVATPAKDQESDKGASKPENELPDPSDQKVLLLKSLLAASMDDLKRQCSVVEISLVSVLFPV
jgi:hypothetical protein